MISDTDIERLQKLCSEAPLISSRNEFGGIIFFSFEALIKPLLEEVIKHRTVLSLRDVCPTCESKRTGIARNITIVECHSCGNTLQVDVFENEDDE